MGWPWVFLRPGDVAAIAIAVGIGGYFVFAFGFPHAWDRNQGFGPGWDCQRDFCVRQPPANSASGIVPANREATK
jgi:hypothetical protein